MMRHVCITAVIFSIVASIHSAVLYPKQASNTNSSSTPSSFLGGQKVTNNQGSTTTVRITDVQEAEAAPSFQKMSDNEVADAPGPASTPACTNGFEYNMYHLTLNESQTYDTLPLHPPVSACKNESDLIYTLEALPMGNPPNVSFWMNNATGELHMEGELDYEDSQFRHFDLVIKVENGKGSSGIAYVDINVIDINDNKPEMVHDHYLSEHVKEDAAVGAYLLQVTAKDADSGNNAAIKYHLEAVNKEHCVFEIDPDSGIVTLNETLDYETHHYYACNVYAKETSTTQKWESKRAKIIANVTDINDNSPDFTQSEYKFVMSSPLTRNQYVGTVTAYDKDSGNFGNVKYSIESPFDEFLTINSSGTITVKNETLAPYKDEPSLHFLVLVQDGGTQPRIGQTDVFMKMVKGYKRWFFYQESYNFTVGEQLPPGTEVGRVEVNATDISYTTDTSKYVNLPFNVTDNGIIYLAATQHLDYESENKTYFFVVAARDKLATVFVNVTVNVKDYNDNHPDFVKPSNNDENVTISLLTKSETPVYTVSATDKDSGDNGLVTYSIPSLLEGEYFSVNNSSGLIRIRKSAFTYGKDVIELTVQATDHGVPPNSRDIHLNFVIKKEGIHEEYVYIEINENVEVKINSTTLLGTFEDLKADLSFAIDNGDNRTFSVSRDTGLSGNGLDYEVDPYKELKINATSGNFLVGIIHVAIKVNDVNDNSPVFLLPSLKTFDLPNDAKPNVPIFQFVAHDADSLLDGNGVVEYTLTIDKSIFHLDNATGILTLARTLQKTDTGKTFEAVVTATDHGQTRKNAVSSKINFTVFDPDNGQPRFDELAYFGEVPEDKGIGYRVLLAEPTLRQNELEHDVTVDVGGTDKTFYTKAPYGDLIVNGTLNREVKYQYPLGIQSAANQNLNTKKTTVFALVTVTDVNDNAPKFPFSVNLTSVNSDSPRNVTVATIEAVDKDDDAKLNYKITGGNHLQYFFLNNTDNIVTVNAQDPSLLSPNETYHLELFVDDGIPEHNDTMNLLVEVN